MRTKKSFSLFEVIVSMLILSLVLISMLKLYYDDNSIITLYNLQKIENEYIEKGKLIETKNLKFSYGD